MTKDPRELYTEIEHLSKAGGGLAVPNRIIWNSLLAYQTSDRKITGHAMEIGVWHGFGSGYVLAHLAPQERLLMIDKYMSWSVFGDTLCHFSEDAKDKTEFVRKDSRLIGHEELDGQFANGCRFIHIDGEHSYSAVLNDLELSERMLCDAGVIVVDDVLNHLCPQVTHAVFDYLKSSSELEAVFFGFNKAYLVRKDYEQHYRDWFSAAFILNETPLLDVTVSFGSEDASVRYWSILPRGQGPRFIVVARSTNKVEELPMAEFMSEA